MSRNNPNEKMQLLIRNMGIVLVIGLILAAIFAWALPSWLADLSLDVQLYKNKAGGVDFIQVAYLNWASFWVPLIPAAIATVILVNPKKFLAIFPARKQSTRRIVSIVFSLLIFAISYGFGWLLDDLSYGIFMSQYLGNTTSYVSVLDSFVALNIPFNPETYDTNVLLTWRFITLPLMNTVLVALLFRTLLEMIGQKVKGGYPIEFLGRIFFLIGIIIAFFYLASPLGTYDRVERTWLLIVPLTMWTLLGVGAGCLLFSLLARNKRMNEEIAGGTFLVTVIVVIGMIIVPCVMAAGDFISRSNRWQEIVWEGKERLEVQQTRIASDLTGFQYVPVDNIRGLPTNYSIVDHIRLFDKGSSKQRLENQIEKLYETKDDTDIININNSEFWIAPKSFNPNSTAFLDSYLRHVSLVNTSGFVAMNAHTGVVVPENEYLTTFGVPEQYPIFFGEGYRNDVILNVSGYNITYDGKPDGYLDGYYGFMKTMGLSIDFFPISGQGHGYLRRTNIFDRVGGMLLPYMYMDEDPYIVFNKGEGRMYYSVPISLSLPGFAYYKSNYRRFLGWVIVDVANGEMDFYRNPALNVSDLISFAQIYANNEIYPWSDDIPTWLQDQLRYPEGLFEAQLRTDYKYHQTEPNVWRGQSDVFERPIDGDLYYVIMDIGEGLEFVGVDIVKPTQNTETLAGMYVIRLKPEHFGEVIFYDVKEGERLIGPVAARDRLNTTESAAIGLLESPDFGNILLYPFAGSLFYVIPVYSTVGELQELEFIGLVNGFNDSEVFFGETIEETFAELKALYPETAGSGPRQYGNIIYQHETKSSIEDPGFANISISVKNDEANLSASPINITVGIVAYNQSQVSIRTSGSTTDLPGTTFVDQANGNQTATRFELGNWLLYPSETRTIAARMALDTLNFYSMDLPVRFELMVGNETLNESQTDIITFYAANQSSNEIPGNPVSMEFTMPSSVIGSGNAVVNLNVTNADTNFSAPARNVKVNITTFYADNDNVSVLLHGNPLVPVNFTSSFYTGHDGYNFTIVDENLPPAGGTYGTSFEISLDHQGIPTGTLVLYMTLIVDDVIVGTTYLRTITWT